MLSFSLRLIRPYTRQVILVAFVMLAQTLARLASPWTLKLVLDCVLGDEAPPSWLAWLVGDPAGPDRTLWVAVGGTLVIALVEAVCQYASALLTATIGQRVAHDLRQMIYAHLQRLSLAYFDKQELGSIVSTVTEDIKVIQDFASQQLVVIVVDVLTIVGIAAVMLSIDWAFTLVALAAMPLVIWFAYWSRKALKVVQRDVRAKQSEIVSIVQEGLGAIRVVKAFARGRYERARLDAKSLESVDAALEARKLRALLPSFMTLVVAVGTAGVLAFGTQRVRAGALSTGALVVFLTYVARLFAPIQELARASTDMAQAGVSLERVQAILDADERLARRPDAKPLTGVRGRVDLDRVSFGYDPARLVLEDVTFTVEPGQRVGLVGPSGSGKSTLVSLLPRFYDVTSGAVRIDGTDVRDVTIRSLRQSVAFVLQETQLFRGTVRYNIAYGRDEATEDEIVAAAQAAHAHDFVMQLPDGYDTVVGPGGVSLSGGQRQRLGIARAMVKNAPILILDEPSAALDSESERLVFEALDRLMQDKTTFVIAHRLATVRRADFILVLDAGRIVERGTHDELVAAGGLYAKLQRDQLV